MVLSIVIARELGSATPVAPLSPIPPAEGAVEGLPAVHEPVPRAGEAIGEEVFARVSALAEGDAAIEAEARRIFSATDSAREEPTPRVTAHAPGVHATPPVRSVPSQAVKYPALSASRPSTGPSSPRPTPQREPSTAGKEIVFVIDDVGWNVVQLKPFLAFPGPITFAIMPNLAYTREAIALIKAAGKEYILHQPMEAINGLDAGPGALLKGMSASTVQAIIESNLDSMPGAVGMNNHMGSAASADPSLMSSVISVAKRRGIYYLDSRTIGDSVARQSGRRIGVHTWERDVFVDNVPDRSSIVRFINEGLKISEKRGYAVMIGHVWSAELAQTLVDLYPQLIEQGFSLSTISRLILEEGDADSGD